MKKKERKKCDRNWILPVCISMFNLQKVSRGPIMQSNRIIASLRLQKAIKVMQSNHQPIPATHTELCRSVLHHHVS